MRKFQLTIKLDCFHEPGKHKTVGVYADANNIWEAICAGFNQLANTLMERGFALPSFGYASSNIEGEESQ